MSLGNLLLVHAVHGRSIGRTTLEALRGAPHRLVGIVPDSGEKQRVDREHRELAAARRQGHQNTGNKRNKQRSEVEAEKEVHCIYYCKSYYFLFLSRNISLLLP